MGNLGVFYGYYGKNDVIFYSKDPIGKQLPCLYIKQSSPFSNLVGTESRWFTSLFLSWTEWRTKKKFRDPTHWSYKNTTRFIQTNKQKMRLNIINLTSLYNKNEKRNFKIDLKDLLSNIEDFGKNQNHRTKDKNRRHQ